MVAAMQVLSTAVQRAIVQHASGAAMLNLLQKQVKPPLAYILVDVPTISFCLFIYLSLFLHFLYYNSAILTALAKFIRNGLK